MNKKIIIAIICLAVAIISISTIFVINKNNEKIIQGEVETKTVDLSSKLTGRVNKIHVQKGDIVKKGDLLITLDTPEINAKATQTDASLEIVQAQEQISYDSYKQAQAQAELAKKTYERLERLYKEGVIPAQKRDEAKAKYLSAKENVNAGKTKYTNYSNASIKKAQGAINEVQSYLKENKIIAPIDGQITEIGVEEGELVGAGFPIVSIVSVEDNWLTFNLREDYLQKVKIGKTFMATIPAISNEPIEVKVNYISALGNYATWRATKIRGDFDLKTFEVRAVPTKPIKDLKAGMTAIVDWNKVK
ncbi:MAG: efflux RND transporter periplasmic adaptor subunit [bacterium]|nr:efflux RND transporter periplasmic adaptor subunit [bacterium]